jgi:hypothetical protein
MRFIDWFRSDFSVTAPKVCLGCAARQAHIEDLQALLRSERQSNQNLQTLMFARAGFGVQTPQTAEPSEMKPLRSIQTTAQLRRQAEDKEAKEHPDARKDYWLKVQGEYDKAGKLPEKPVA